MRIAQGLAWKVLKTGPDTQEVLSAWNYCPIPRSPFLRVQSSRRPNASIGCHVPESVKSQDHLVRQLNPVSVPWHPGDQVLDSREAF